jgi:hypothetical protein
MDARLRHRFAIVLAGGALLALFSGAGTALAKGQEGMAVALTQPIPRDAQPGTILTVEFEAIVATETGPSPVIGSPVFVRLIAPDGTTSEGFGTELRGKPGVYQADVVVPAGGIKSAEFGLRGTAYIDGKASRSDEMFEIHGWLFTTTGVAAGSGSSTATALPVDLPVMIAIVLGAGLLAAAIVVAVRSRRGRGLATA